MTQTTKSRRGFASMDPEKRREIARKGGAAVPAEKRSFTRNAELAKRAGAAGGKNVSPGKRSFSKSSALAKSAGRKGGLHTQRKKHDD